MNPSELNLTAIQQAASALICDHLHAGRSLCFTMSTSSMWPTLAPGDKVTVTATRPDELRPGDVVVRKVANAWITHRLIRSYTSDNEIHLVTKGDNSLRADDAWQATQLVGKVVAVERAGRKTSARFAQARRRAFVIALLSRSQLSTSRIKPKLFQRMAVRILRTGLRVVVWTAR